MGELAAAEQVSAPTMSRLIRDLVRQGLVRRVTHPDDGRVQLVEATPKGRELLERGRSRRVRLLESDLRSLDPEERDLLERATEVLERVALPHAHPGRDGRE
jgi:DNA-binding MarR family transcriptional regulator